jgi:hypothetical protein
VAEERDPVLERVVRELSALPPANPDATARIVAMAMERSGGAPRPIAAAMPTPARAPVRGRRFSIAAVGSLAAAAAVAGFVLRGFVPQRAHAVDVAQSPAPAPATATTASTGAARLASLDADGSAPLQFVLRAPNAHRVSLVGDFNGGDVARSPMRDATASGVWTVTVPLKPGRHVYAFLVDDSTWTLDPRAPRTTDPDFGVAGSVVIVGVR